MAMRRAAVLTTSSIAGLVLLLALKPHHTVLPVLATSRGGATVSSPEPGPSSSRSSKSSKSGKSSTQKRGSSRGGATGTYTGDVEQTPFGPVEVAVTLSHGKLTKVKTLQTPNDAGQSRAIAAHAVPILTREALAAHSAHIDAVSGASYTSEGYIESLQSALDKARA
ncbi:FMN-binding protein [Nonomuraea sp. NPDC049784]|uniref:FMN-binding protein n=1 Tax=Nonomuraea sp. NPDC049784 TaxID=3154361 RepID=UPI00340B2EDE